MPIITVTGTNVTHPAYSTNSVTFPDPKSASPPLLLDTLAQLSTKGAVLAVDERLLKRAKSKYYTAKIALPLADLHGPLEKYYRRAYYCCHNLVQVKDTVTSKYCNSRICYTCNRIRTAKLINGYETAIRAMQEPRLVTLTFRNVPGAQLSVAITGMQNVFRQITVSNRIRNSRKRLETDIVTLKGIRKLEVTFNQRKQTFHPHFHIICDGEEAAELLVREWLKRFPGRAERKGQDIRPVNEEAILELFKYSTKLIGSKGKPIPARALDVIMQALHGRRIVQPFGGIRFVSEDVENLRSDTYQGLPDYDIIEWIWQEHDWINCYAECLTGYMPKESG